MYICNIYIHIYMYTSIPKYKYIYIYIIIIIIVIINLDTKIRANRFSIRVYDKRDNFIFFVGRKSYVAIFFQRYSTLHLRQKHCEEI